MTMPPSPSAPRGVAQRTRPFGRPLLSQRGASTCGPSTGGGPLEGVPSVCGWAGGTGARFPPPASQPPGRCASSRAPFGRPLLNRRGASIHTGRRRRRPLEGLRPPAVGRAEAGAVSSTRQLPAGGVAHSVVLHSGGRAALGGANRCRAPDASQPPGRCASVPAPVGRPRSGGRGAGVVLAPLRTPASRRGVAQAVGPIREAVRRWAGRPRWFGLCGDALGCPIVGRKG